MKGGKKFQDAIIKGLAVVGLLSLLAFGSFLTISIVKYLPVAFSRLSSAAVSLSSVFIAREQLILAIDTHAINSKTTFTISWKHTGGKRGGSFGLSYACLPGFSFGVGNEIILCGNVYILPTEKTSITLTPFSLKSRYVDMPIIISYIPKNAIEPSISESATVTIINEKLVSSIIKSNDEILNSKTSSTFKATSGTGSTQNYSSPVTLTPPINNPNGKADLKPTILEIGIIDLSSNTFVATSTIRRSDRVAVRFSVENLGTKSSDPWRFNAILPTYPTFTFNSDTEQSLNPGDHIEYNIAFDRIIEGSNEFKVVVDGANQITEVNESNNAATVTIKAL